LDVSFAQNPAYEWLMANAHHFGFILRYPKEKEKITGYTYEPWHYRFVGVEAASKIHRKGLILEEYLD
jgi:D-alanyl-D-alanine carboxypeptidase